MSSRGCIQGFSFMAETSYVANVCQGGIQNCFVLSRVLFLYNKTLHKVEFSELLGKLLANG